MNYSNWLENVLLFIFMFARLTVWPKWKRVCDTEKVPYASVKTYCFMYELILHSNSERTLYARMNMIIMLLPVSGCGCVFPSGRSRRSPDQWNQINSPFFCRFCFFLPSSRDCFVIDVTAGKKHTTTRTTSKHRRMSADQKSPIVWIINIAQSAFVGRLRSLTFTLFTMHHMHFYLEFIFRLWRLRCGWSIVCPVWFYIPGGLVVVFAAWPMLPVVAAHHHRNNSPLLLCVGVLCVCTLCCVCHFVRIIWRLVLSENVIKLRCPE